MGSDDEGSGSARPGKSAASEVKAQKLESSFKKTVGGKLNLKGVDFKGGKIKKKKKGAGEVVELKNETREAELDARVKKKSDRFCMHT